MSKKYNNDIYLKFPDVSDYDFQKAGHVALYHAHFDFYSIRGLIESTNKSTYDIAEHFRMSAIIADDFGDIYTHSKENMNLMLYNSRVVPLAYNSCLLIMISALEEAFNILCNAYYIKNDYKIEFTDLHGQGLERAISYLEKVVGLQNIKKEKQWEYIKTARDVRNAIAHNGGRVKEKDIKKFEKFNFYIREEDKQVFVESDTLIKLYDEILSFINCIFNKEPN